MHLFELGPSRNTAVLHGPTELHFVPAIACKARLRWANKIGVLYLQSISDVLVEPPVAD